MIRWLVLVLLLGNGIYFAWHVGHKVANGQQQQSQISNSQGEVLEFLSDSGAGHAGSPVAVSAAVPAPTAAPSTCQMVGPFKEKVSALQMRARLGELGIGSTTYQISIPDKIDYWVHLGPLRTRKQALELLHELQSKKIDSFLIADGELSNGISLGFFTREELAQSVLKTRKEQGYDAKIRAVPRVVTEFWELVPEDQRGRLTAQGLMRLRSGMPGVEVRKNSCDLIATAEKLD